MYDAVWLITERIIYILYSEMYKTRWRAQLSYRRGRKKSRVKTTRYSGFGTRLNKIFRFYRGIVQKISDENTLLFLVNLSGCIQNDDFTIKNKMSPAVRGLRAGPEAGILWVPMGRELPDTTRYRGAVNHRRRMPA